jgi:hypothetical protein
MEELCTMAKQIGEIRITGTVAGITFYRMDGQYYARRKSSLRGERVKGDKRFRRTMESAGRLGRGSQWASRVYRSLPREQQVYALFCRLKSAAIRALKEGKKEKEVQALLGAIAGTKDKGQSTKDKGRSTRRETSNVRRETGSPTKPWPGAGGQLFVDAAGRLVGMVGVTSPQRSTAQSP